MGGSGVWEGSGGKPCYNLMVFERNNEDFKSGRRYKGEEKDLNAGGVLEDTVD